MNVLQPTPEQLRHFRRDLAIAGLVAVCGGPAILLLLGLSLAGLVRLLGAGS